MYTVVEVSKNDEFELGNFEEVSKAIIEARCNYDRLTASERKYTTIEVRVYEDDSREETGNFDCDLIQWEYLIRDSEAGNVIDHFGSKEETCKALQGYVLDDREEEPNKSDQELLDFYEVVDLLEELPINPVWNEGTETVTF